MSWGFILLMGIISIIMGMVIYCISYLVTNLNKCEEDLSLSQEEKENLKRKANKIRKELLRAKGLRSK